MNYEKKNEILKKRLDTLLSENEELKKKIDNIPEIKDFLDELELYKEEYSKLIVELHDEINRYEELNKDFALLKKSYEKELKNALFKAKRGKL